MRILSPVIWPNMFNKRCIWNIDPILLKMGSLCVIFFVTCDPPICLKNKFTAHRSNDFLLDVLWVKVHGKKMSWNHDPYQICQNFILHTLTSYHALYTCGLIFTFLWTLVLVYPALKRKHYLSVKGKAVLITGCDTGIFYLIIYWFNAWDILLSW